MTVRELPPPPPEWRATAHRAAVLGSPVGHSLSPVLHNAAYHALGLPWTYSRREVHINELAEVLDTSTSADVGFSLTMPLKEEALRLADDCTERALSAGAANTLVRRDGHWLADATDAAGIVNAVREVDGRQVFHTMTVLGSGATARTAVQAAATLGVGSLTVVARHVGAAQAAVELAQTLGLNAQAIGWDAPATALRADVVVSTVPAGAADVFVTDIDGDLGVLLDVVYAPWPGRLVEAWAAHGGAVIPGTRMLLHQAAEQVELMTGVPAPVHKMREALLADGAPV